jgi:starch phosphorylase
VNVKDPICGMSLESDETKFKSEFLTRQCFFDSEYCMRSFIEGPRIAYFSMEVGIKNDISTYSGGLGILAGDVIRSSADLRIPLVAVTLLSRVGYLKQKITPDGAQVEYPEEWEPSKFMKMLPVTVIVRIGDKGVKVGAWVYHQESVTGGVVPVLFLTTDVEGNDDCDREITDSLYRGDEASRLKQEVVLGIGGVKILEALKINIKKYHMNEGHSSLLTLELLKKYEMNADKVKNLCVFTTHTPVEAAFDKFSYELISRVLGPELPQEILIKFGGSPKLNMTILALNLSKYTNGVTKSHMKYSRKIFPGYNIQEITNGVHSYTWTCQYFRQLFDTYIRGWANEPELLVRVDAIPNNELWTAHMKSKQDLLDFVKERVGVRMDVGRLTMGFARRATEYKRATMIFSDLEKLREVGAQGKIQLVFAGKAHPRDERGKMLIRDIYKYIDLLNKEIEVVYLENYDMKMAELMTSGVDIWLNTPLPPYEASGTSGMKAAHNGVVNFSVLDGWWVEGCVEGLTGWAIGPYPDQKISEDERRKIELADLYNKLEYLIIPKFYKERDSWISIMRNSIGKIAYYFNTHRMMRRYATDAYI